MISMVLLHKAVALYIKNQSLCDVLIKWMAQSSKIRASTSPCQTSLASESAGRWQGLGCVWYQTALPEKAFRLVGMKRGKQSHRITFPTCSKYLWWNCECSEGMSEARAVWFSVNCQLGNWGLAIPTLSLLPFRLCTEPARAAVCIGVQWCLSGNNSFLFPETLSKATLAISGMWRSSI